MSDSVVSNLFVVILDEVIVKLASLFLLLISLDIILPIVKLLDLLSL